MKRFLAICSLLTAFAFVGGDLAFAGAEKDPLKPRVPKSDRGKAKKIKPPAELYKKTKKASDEIVAEGKKIFEGKGTLRQLSREKGRRRRSGRKSVESRPAELYQLQIPQETERRRIVLDYQERQPGDRYGVHDSGDHHGRRSVEGIGLRAKLLYEMAQEKEVVVLSRESVLEAPFRFNPERGFFS